MFRRFTIFMLPCAKQTSDVCPIHIKEKNISKIKSNGRQEVPWGDMVEKGRNIER